MRVVLVGYLLVTALFYCYTGAVCIGKRHAPGAGTLGLALGVLGGGLIWAAVMDGTVNMPLTMEPQKLREWTFLKKCWKKPGNPIKKAIPPISAVPLRILILKRLPLISF